MDIKNKTKKDVLTGFSSTYEPIYMFPDGAKTPSDMPAMLSVGASYKATDKLSVSGSFYYYFDKAVSYGKKSIYTNEFVSNDSLINDNFIDIAFGLEYSVTDKLLLSAGYLYGKTGVKPEYNSDLSYSLSSHTFGLGGKYAISPKMDVNLGVGYSMYQNSDKIVAEYNSKETYKKNTLIIGVGLDIKLGK
jgi:long-subunit fatty acid transport protein